MHYLHLAADSDRALEITPEEMEHYKNLVKETGALFGRGTIAAIIFCTR